MPHISREVKVGEKPHLGIASADAKAAAVQTPQQTVQNRQIFRIMSDDSKGHAPVFSTPPTHRRRRLSFLPRVASSESKNSSNNKFQYRLVVMGSAQSGKSSIIQQFLYEKFSTEYHPTVEQYYQGEYEIRGIGTVALDILDTSGSYPFPAMRRLAISKGDAFALVYSIDNEESFDEVRQLRDLIIQVRGTEDLPPIVVVGNKLDLSKDKRQVSFELAECECIDWDSGFVECSAKNNENILQIFQSIIMQAKLRGSLTKDSPQHTYNNSQGVGSHLKQRKSSSLPINDFFLHNKNIGSLRKTSSSSSSSSFHKRNSCTLS